MNDQIKPQEQADVPPAMAADAKAHLMARRRMMLKGLSKGGAVLAASTASIHSLASGTTFVTRDNHICSISGQHSAVHSATTNTETCGGYRCDTYKDKTKWPGNVNCNADNRTVCKDSKLEAYGEEDSSPDDDESDREKYDGNNWTDAGRGKVKHCHPDKWKTDRSKKYSKYKVTCTLYDVMDFHADKNKDQDEVHWIGAWLNACNSRLNFPYSPDEVKAYYGKGKGTPEYENALAFFKTLEIS